jgi:hypothetical protein
MDQIPKSTDTQLHTTPPAPRLQMDSARFPHAEATIAQWLGPDSLFDPQLVQEHVEKALAFAKTCDASGQPLLDPCGPRGDLFFLLQALSTAGQST